MKIIFAGTPKFAIPALQKIINSNHEICAVYTRPDKPAGRGQKLTPTPVKVVAEEHNLPIYQPKTLKAIEAQEEMKSLNPDILINVAYGMLLPEEILNIPKFGCINIHPSMLPLYRGAAPIQRAIESCDDVTGVTIMKMDIGLDTGDIYKQEIMPIEKNDTSETLAKKASEVGARLLLDVITEIENGTDKPTKQDDDKSTYANKLTKEEGKIDWNKSAKEIDCMIRAFIPWPVAYTEIDDKYIRVWEAEVIEEKTTEKPGAIIEANKKGVKIATSNGILSLLKIQLPNKKPLLISDVLNANQNLFESGKKLA